MSKGIQYFEQELQKIREAGTWKSERVLTSDQKARTDGLDWICQAAGSGYWSALRFLHENKDFYPLPTRILDFIGSESDFSEDAARRYESIVNYL